jgi:TM2 domain-containing membrane protein YozV
VTTKECPYCGEEIKAMAIRCKHCHAEVPRSQEPEKETSPEHFEERFLEFAYRTTSTLNAPSVAHALKIPIAEAAERLEELAASDVLIRHVDDLGYVSFTLPGRGGSMVPYESQLPAAPAPSESTAALGLVVNALFLPGLGSLIIGKVGPGIAQLVLFLVGIPLCFVLIGFPMIFAAWAWGISTGVATIQEARSPRKENK